MSKFPFREKPKCELSTKIYQRLHAIDYIFSYSDWLKLITTQWCSSAHRHHQLPSSVKNTRIDRAEPQTCTCLTNKNISVWISHAFKMICLITSTRIVCRPTTTRVTVKKIIVTTFVEGWSIRIQWYCVWHHPSTLPRNLFNQFTNDWPRLLSHYAASTFLACDPVVDVALDQGFLANGAPQSKVHGFIMRLAQWNCCGHSNVSGAGWPGWTRGDSVWSAVEIGVICESVTPN